MSKTITLRLSDDEYKRISETARMEHRPISNFITACVIRELTASYYTDSIETAQITTDKQLTKKLKSGHRDARKMKGRLVG